MSARYYAERDGGPSWTGTYTSYQPYVYYVVDAETHERIDCRSELRSKTLAAQLNVGDVQWAEAKAEEEGPKR